MAKQKKPATVAASDFKASWYTWLERVNQNREEIVVTRYGKPVARLVPFEDDDDLDTPIFGRLRGTVTILGDIVGPIADPWEADA